MADDYGASIHQVVRLRKEVEGVQVSKISEVRADLTLNIAGALKPHTIIQNNLLRLQVVRQSAQPTLAVPMCSSLLRPGHKQGK